MNVGGVKDWECGKVSVFIATGICWATSIYLEFFHFALKFVVLRQLGFVSDIMVAHFVFICRGGNTS